MEGIVSSDEEEILPQQSPEPEETEEEGQFVFRRNKQCTYHMVRIIHVYFMFCIKFKSKIKSITK